MSARNLVAIHAAAPVPIELVEGLGPVLATYAPQCLPELVTEGFEAFVAQAGESMFGFLVGLGLFRTRNEARRNWTRTGRDVPAGVTVFEDLGKMRKRLFVLNLVEAA